MNARIVAPAAVRKAAKKRVAYMTTSWDDGDPLDQRLADLLSKYGLRGTFYIPRHAENETMPADQMRHLSRTFEVGAHTMNHLVLPLATEAEAKKEIIDSKAWIEDCTGLPCRMFCPPKGKYTRRHLVLVRQAGYVGMRTVQLLSLAFPRARAGLLVLPTTVQACPHGLGTYLRNSIRNAAITALWRYLVHGRSTQWAPLVYALLSQVIERGGVFHLWGHSWEVEKHGQWHRLEEVLRFMSQFTSQAKPLTNYEICQATNREASYQNDVTAAPRGGGMPAPDEPKATATKEHQRV
jgi:peptidoglycan/xylan/chitin deacetylase (PgdA/CDA1 family)